MGGESMRRVDRLLPEFYNLPVSLVGVGLARQ